jgi:transcription termination factor Rho
VELPEEPGALNLKDLKDKKIADLAAIAKDMSIEGAAAMRKQELIFSSCRRRPSRTASSAARACSRSCPTASASCVPRLQLPARAGRHLRLARARSGASTCARATSVAGQIRPPKEGERYFALSRSRRSIRGAGEGARKDPLRQPDAALSRRAPALEFDHEEFTTRIIDLLTPIGKGQRG